MKIILPEAGIGASPTGVAQCRLLLAPGRMMKIAALPLLLAILAVLVLLAGGPGYRFGLWGLDMGLRGALQYGLFAGIAAVGLAIALLFMRRQRRENTGKLVLAIVVGLVPPLVFLWLINTAEQHPIHDITTDLDDPPRFDAVREIRADAPNPAEYAGPETADAQRKHYPGLAPLTADVDRRALYEHALAAARASGWDIVASDADAGRIEASDTTMWYGFTDDIVIRVRSTSEGSRLDVRSKSRVGRSDLGKNAKRINAYLDRLRARMEGG
jgi:uncharacterized protein (DUF1499 family)